MIIEKTGQSRYIQDSVKVCMTKANGKKPDYAVAINADEIKGLNERDMGSLFQILYKMVENGTSM